jgi:2-polyprenyl-3-methyl-5-hydroxy-6-metoxy-1,4-benzoquinol methylase
MKLSLSDLPFVRRRRRPAGLPRRLSEEAGLWGYRLFLDREPESPAVVREKVRTNATTRDLRRDFVNAEEFKLKNPGLFPRVFSGYEAPLSIEDACSDEDMTRLFQHVQGTWRLLGEAEPFWSVMTLDSFLAERIGETRAVFYAIGDKETDRIVRTLERNRVDPRGLRTCLDFGCGVGRLLPSLASRFERVWAYDISDAHLEIARRHLSESGIHHVDFSTVTAIEDLNALQRTDLLVSVIVLQHNPPPVTAYMVRRLLRSLNPGGVAYLQVLTYREGYSFDLKEYLQTRTAEPEMELHVLPQRRLFQILAEEGCAVLEVSVDDRAGLEVLEVSNTFLVRRA